MSWENIQFKLRQPALRRGKLSTFPHGQGRTLRPTEYSMFSPFAAFWFNIPSYIGMARTGRVAAMLYQNRRKIATGQGFFHVFYVRSGRAAGQAGRPARGGQHRLEGAGEWLSCWIYLGFCRSSAAWVLGRVVADFGRDGKDFDKQAGGWRGRRRRTQESRIKARRAGGRRRRQESRIKGRVAEQTQESRIKGGSGAVGARRQESSGGRSGRKNQAAGRVGGCAARIKPPPAPG